MATDSYIVKGAIWTGDSAKPYADCFRVEGGRFAEVGSASELRPRDGEKVCDYGENLIVPGFTDAHMHLTAYSKLHLYKDLASVGSLEELKEILRAEAAKTEKGKWLRCINFNETTWERKILPHIKTLDEVAPDTPLILSRYCGHKHIVNTAGFKKSGLWDSTDPNVERDAKGNLTGVINEGGAGCIIDEVAAEYETRETMRRLLTDTCRHLSSLGIIAVHANDAPSYALGEALAVMQDMDEDGELPIRVHCYHDRLPNYDVRSNFGNEKIAFAGLKLFADGALGSHTAALNEPYSDDAANCGQLNHTDEELYELLLEAHKRHIQVQIHAIGDKAMEQVVTAIEKVIAACGKPFLPYRINHAIVCPKELIARIVKTGSVIDLQPIMAHTDRNMAPARLGPERTRLVYPFRTFSEAGILLTGSSDAPIEDPNPWLNMWNACTKSNFDGTPIAGYDASEVVDLSTALKFYTVNPWQALGLGDSHGKIKAGYHADYVAVNGNPFKLHKADLYKVTNKATFLDGKCVWKEARQS